MPEPIVAYWEALPVWITFGLKVLAALLLLGIAVWGWVRWPKRVAARLALDDPQARADVEDNFRKTVGQVLGGAIVLLGAGLAYLQFLQQQRASDLQSSRQQQASHDLLISNQVSKGFEQLGSDKIVIRLGGIYALEGVMNGSDQYHQAVLEALCAFVREGAKPSHPEPPPSPEPAKETVSDGPPTDIQAALTVIVRRSGGEGLVNLRDANIPGVNLGAADLTGVDLTRANLSGANLFRADLSWAYLTGADLTGAMLMGAKLAGADLSGANLTRANLAYVDLTTVDLDEACGSDAKLSPGLTLKPCPPKSPL
jgi:Pentapeptide repeats (8 copies)